MRAIAHRRHTPARIRKNLRYFVPTVLTQCDTPRKSRQRCNVRFFGTSSKSADGTRLFFEWLEKKYGARFGGRSLPMDGPPNNTNDSSQREEIVLTRDSLQLDDLQRLFRHEITALRIKGFYPKHEAVKLGKEIASEAHTQNAQNWKVSTSKGLESSDVITVGRHPPYNIASANDALDEYFDEVRMELRDRRGLLASTTADNENKASPVMEHKVSFPKLWPLDLLRLELDELWPKGAGLARSHANPDHCMGGGLPRLMVGPTRWKEGLVHVDELAPLNENSGCFSANIYLQLPYRASTTENSTGCDDNGNDAETLEEQSVMEIWPLGIRSKWDWYRNAPTLSHLTSQDPEGQVILRKVLGHDYKQQITVQPGDLVLLCVQRPHCAIGFGHQNQTNQFTNSKRTIQTRVSLQCFLQYNGSEGRLTLDS